MYEWLVNGGHADDFRQSASPPTLLPPGWPNARSADAQSGFKQAPVTIKKKEREKRRQSLDDFDALQPSQRVKRVEKHVRVMECPAEWNDDTVAFQPSRRVTKHIRNTECHAEGSDEVDGFQPSQRVRRVGTHVSDYGWHAQRSDDGETESDEMDDVEMKDEDVSLDSGPESEQEDDGDDKQLRDWSVISGKSAVSSAGTSQDVCSKSHTLDDRKVKDSEDKRMWLESQIFSFHRPRPNRKTKPSYRRLNVDRIWLVAKKSAVYRRFLKERDTLPVILKRNLKQHCKLQSHRHDRMIPDQKESRIVKSGSVQHNLESKSVSQSPLCTSGKKIRKFSDAATGASSKLSKKRLQMKGNEKVRESTLDKSVWKEMTDEPQDLGMKQHPSLANKNVAICKPRKRISDVQRSGSEARKGNNDATRGSDGDVTLFSPARKELSEKRRKGKVRHLENRRLTRNQHANLQRKSAEHLESVCVPSLFDSNSVGSHCGGIWNKIISEN
ncbi:uncharacterized protein [Ptychodera flava]|uniref:uncharacterized protein isoform X2 n=1 Tax=Ptychodera flava TaxID=63121 RepID=UPI00396A58F5